MLGIIISLILLSGIIAEVTWDIYKDKEITLTKEQKNALETKNLTSYNIEDNLVNINGQARTSRCIIKNNQTIRCFNVINGNLKSSEILTKLDEAEKKVIIQEANNIIKSLDKSKTKIGEGKTIIKW